MLVFNAACVSCLRVFALTNRAASSRPAAEKATQAFVRPIRQQSRVERSDADLLSVLNIPELLLLQQISAEARLVFPA
jgi:hypothetical protein